MSGYYQQPSSSATSPWYDPNATLYPGQSQQEANDSAGDIPYPHDRKAAEDLWNHHGTFIQQYFDAELKQKKDWLRKPVSVQYRKVDDEPMLNFFIRAPGSGSFGEPPYSDFMDDVSELPDDYSRAQFLASPFICLTPILEQEICVLARSWISGLMRSYTPPNRSNYINLNRYFSWMVSVKDEAGADKGTYWSKGSKPQLPGTRIGDLSQQQRIALEQLIALEARVTKDEQERQRRKNREQARTQGTIDID
ncbi:hypothetical protein F5X96DRAFT_669546 [Biscogniauxia mediterranea]|nr:hypothetical protein F5X96DRAFT_669546 [Biscogniauxia mediterranea]